MYLVFYCPLLASYLRIIYFIVLYVVTGIPIYAAEPVSVYDPFLLGANVAEHRNCPAVFFVKASYTKQTKILPTF